MPRNIRYKLHVELRQAVFDPEARLGSRLQGLLTRSSAWKEVRQKGVMLGPYLIVIGPGGQFSFTKVIQYTRSGEES